MRLVLATGNKGKLQEFRQLCDEEIVPFCDLLGDFEIIEDGDTFAANALIKARTIYNKLDKNSIVIADDSGISVPLLGGIPGIYSARYAQDEIVDRKVNDKDNRDKLIVAIQNKKVNRTPAHYTAAIAIVSKLGEYVVHGWMYGEVIDTPRGEKGFGYDPMFIPQGYTQTIAEIEEQIKQQISHRGQAMALAKPIIKMLYGKIV